MTKKEIKNTTIVLHSLLIIASYFLTANELEQSIRIGLVILVSIFCGWNTARIFRKFDIE